MLIYEAKKRLEHLTVGLLVAFVIVIAACVFGPSKAVKTACEDVVGAVATERCLAEETSAEKACKDCRDKEGKAMERIAKTGIPVFMPNCAGCK